MANLFRSLSNAVFGVVATATLGDQLQLLLLLLLFTSTLGAATIVSNTLGIGAAIAVSILVGGVNIFFNCSIASLSTVPCCRKGVAGCGACSISTRSSVALANPSVVAVVGISTFSGKNSIVLVDRKSVV